MNLQVVQTSLAKFIRKHKVRFNLLAAKETQALELGALVLATEHYARRGYKSSVANLQNGYFKVKLKHGHPATFSWYEVSGQSRKLEVHANLLVLGAHGDGGRYEVDVGVVEHGHTPTKAVRAKDWQGHPNALLRTFVEAKKLEIYPMLLAQFTGIVHEIQPQFLNPSATASHDDDFFPALVCLGTLRGTSKAIQTGHAIRGFRMNVIPAFDQQVTAMSRRLNHPSPFLTATSNAANQPPL